MLADELLENGLPEFGSAVKPTLELIRKAQKYVLAPQFAAAADGLAEDFGSLVRAFPFLRLPYSTTWIETAHLDRPNFAAAEVHVPAFQAQASRVGYLLTATRSDLSAWKAHLFWKIKAGPKTGTTYNGSTGATLFDMRDTFPLPEEDFEREGAPFPLSPTGRLKDHPGWTKSDYATRRAMTAHTCPTSADYGHSLLVEQFSTNTGREVFRGVLDQLARSDWAGETAFLTATIGLMNARNATEAERADMSGPNRARAKRGRPLLLEHHVLKIHTRQTRRATEEGDGHHAAMRGHFVRGHWKVRRSGIYFWKPHARGDFKKGTITKDYELTD